MRNATRRRFLATLSAACSIQVLDVAASEASSSSILRLSDLEDRHGGRLGVEARCDGRIVGWRSEERFPYCSTFKVFLAACVMQRVQRGLERLDREIPIREADMVPHAPVTGSAIGSALTIETLMKAAVEVSDNPAANILFREMGGLSVFGDWYRSIGDVFTRVDRMEVNLNSAIPGDPRDTTSPRKFAVNLERVLLGQLLTADHRKRLERWLVETPTGPGRIKAALPGDHRLGHKTGTGANNTCNDIGIVWPPSGSPVVLSVLFTGARDADPRQLDAVVAEASRRALAALGHA